MISDSSAPKLHKNEGLKTKSNYLRGNLLESLADPISGGISEDDAQLTKFHGTYVQDDRDLRNERRKKKLDKAYSFMIRVRVPGGVCTSQQWLQMDELCDKYANGTLKLTTRQAFQFHGVLKFNLKKTMQGINAALMDTIAACGDVNRNVMCNPNPYQSAAHADALKLAQDISDHLTPKTRAYHEIWLDEEPVASSEEEEEPIYGKTYLPRKFKTVVAVPPMNDVDIYAHDLGFIAILEGEKVVGYNVTVGGGMGTTHGNTETYPRLAEVMGFCTPEQAVDVAEKVVLVQRDYGDRTNRAHARLKYTIADRGLKWFREQVEERLGYKLEEAREFKFENTGDRYGWVEGIDGKHHLTLFIQNGRVKDVPGYAMRTGLREIAKVHTGDFRLTCNQNLIIGGVTAEQKPVIEKMVEEYGLIQRLETSGLRLNSMACVALPTCGLALAESERYLPDLVTELEEVVEEAGLRDDEIVIRMTGCPNGCARPFLAEIGFVGKGPGKYNIYLGAAFNGSRLASPWQISVKAEDIKETLKPVILRYSKERNEGERFGDFVMRVGIVKPFEYGMNYHEPIVP
ncbi:MAG: NADPH-dependent assimilatory sulfite reductase hemoprotein subunit [Verrucomicrobiota bacterium JB022]|nr:NADPH-dependent assimilatory sulfite reductase hemoprotein subunit [Verrucomicrobiota bacterium JB022]